MMTEEELERLRYPIGKFYKPDTIDSNQIKTWISNIENFPESVDKLVTNLSIEVLNYPYRPDGWNIKQVVHHCADSHMNAFIRFKLALTEDSPTIRPYFEDRWATLIDGNDNSISDSLILIKSLHAKWTKLLRHLTKEDLKRAYIHPGHGKRFPLEEALGMYAWHCNHHSTHISQALAFKNNF